MSVYLKERKIGKSLLKMLLLCGILFSSHVFAQAQTVTGIVKDLGNEPIIGASVSVKGTTTGTLTDIDGKYTISADAQSVLVFSFIGFTSQEITVGSQKVIDVTLSESDQQLEEVVVTALGMKRSTKALGYAMTELKGDDLANNSNNPIDALQGKVAGLEISGSDGGMFGSAKVQLRGVPTLKGSNRPIYVVDNVILSNDNAQTGNADWDGDANDWGNELKNLNPNDFETVSVLKGAAATALYGSRGLYGAIVITTKSGKGSKGFGVSVNQSFGIDYVYKQPDLQNVYGDGNRAGWVSYGDVDANGNYFSYDNQHQFRYVSDKDKRPMFNNIGLGFGPKFDGRAIVGYDNEETTYNAIKNNYKDMYNLGFTTNTNLVVQGSNDKTTFYSSVSYRHQTGTLPNNEFNRLTLLAKASHKISNRVMLEASANFGKSNPKNAQPNIGEYFASGTFGREYDPSYYRKKYTGEHGGLANTDYDDKYGNVPGRSLWWNIYNNNSSQEEVSFRPSLTLTVDMLEWLKFKAEGNYNYYYTDREQKNPNSGYARSYEGGNGVYAMTKTKKRQTNLNANFLLDKQLNDDWGLTGFLRGEYYDNWQSYMKTSTDGGLVVPDLYFINNSVKAAKSEAYTLGTKRMFSIAGQIGFNWKNKVYVDVTGRNDWSSSLVYSDGTGNFSYFYPSINGSAILTELIDLPDWVSFAKVRASWAQVGNDTDPYSINNAYTLRTTVLGDKYISSLQLDDPDDGNILISKNLKPERKNAWEIGIDWRFLNNRIGIDATYYKENTKNQIMTITVPDVSGISKQIVNAGNIQNSGIEIALHTVPFENKDWKWDVDFTYTRNRSKIVSLHENVADYITLEGYTNYGNYRIGSVAKVGSEYGLLMTDSKPKIDKKTGLEVLNWVDTRRYAYAQRSGEEEKVGSINPDFLGSVATTLRYKRMSLRIGLDMRFGGYVASYHSRYGTAYGYTESSLDYSDKQYGGITWTSAFDGMTYTDGYIPQGIFPAGTSITQANGSKYTVADGGETYKDLYEKGIVEPTHASTWHLYRNSWGQGVVTDTWFKKLNYIALREVSFNYSCPTSFAKKLGASSLSVGVTGRNLGYLLNSMPNHENPESLRGTNAGEFRYRSFGAFTASYMLNISASF
ncbi:MAG: SusC/RagA family TonB-linked outer membrane protein [Prevotella sp.]|nr:SusC/RagA family TonB-linked outer membrane protein [Prevotella sp.]